MKSAVWNNEEYGISQPFGNMPGGSLGGSYQYSENYGWPAGTHIGVDVAIPPGVQIYAAESGTVIQSGFADFFRPAPIWVLEDDGDVAIYGHLWENNVFTGQDISAGQKIGVTGQGQTEQGSWTPSPPPNGPHIHFELRRPAEGANPDGVGMNGYIAVDPIPELAGSDAVPDTENPNPGSGTGDRINDILTGNSEWFEQILLGAAAIVVILVGVVAILPEDIRNQAINLVPVGRAVNKVRKGLK